MAGPAEALSALHQIRAPEATTADLLADAAAAGALGLALALLLAALARLFVWRAPSHRARARSQALAELKASRALPPAERLLVQARLLGRVAPGGDFFKSGPAQELREALYRPHAERVDLEAIDKALARRLRRMRG